MPKLLNKALSVHFVKTAPEGVHSDGNGLTLLVDPAGNRRWFQRLTIAGRKHNVGLGRFPVVSLSEARQQALENLKAVKHGLDPIQAKRDAKAADALQATIPTFSQAVDTVIDLRKAAWSSDKHASQWIQTLHALDATIGGKRVHEITIADVLAILEPMAVATPTSATRLRQRMEIIFDWSIVQGYRQDNPAGKHLLRAMPVCKTETVHHESLNFGDVPAAYSLIGDDTSAKSALRFLILTAGRLGEVTGATWEEIDWTNQTWQIPANRMKARKCHTVPLTTAMLDILQQAWDSGTQNGLIFPGQRGNQLSNRTVQLLLERLEIKCTPHGFRSSFKDWAIESGQDWQTAETALAHRLGSTVEAAYARTTLIERRRVMMEEWNQFITG